MNKVETMNNPEDFIAETCPEALLQDVCKALRADLVTLRKDAERYRWLRDKATTGRAVQLVQWMPGEMDAKVDDAMRVTGAVR